MSSVSENNTAGNKKEDNKIHVLSYFSFPGGGIGRYTHNLLNHLGRQERTDVSLLCLPEFEWIANAEYEVIPRLHTISHPIPALRKARFLISQFTNPLLLTKTAERLGAAIVHLQNVNHLSFRLWKDGLKATGVKIAYTAHDIKRERGIINTRHEVEVLKEFYRYCDLVFVHTASQAEEMIEYAGVSASRLEIVPHGPYDYGHPKPPDQTGVVRNKYGLPEAARVALFFGFIKPYKNLDRLIASLRLIRSDIHLLVAGSGDSRSIGKAKHAIREFGLQDRVTFLEEYVAEDEVADLFMAVDWLVLPYAECFSSQSGVLNIACRYEKPILSTPTISIADSMRKSNIGIVTAGFDEVSIAEGMTRMANAIDAQRDWRFSEYMIQNSWETASALTMAAYRKALCI